VAGDLGGGAVDDDVVEEAGDERDEEPFEDGPFFRARRGRPGSVK
jgi:hypothetical protein